MKPAPGRQPFLTRLPSCESSPLLHTVTLHHGPASCTAVQRRDFPPQGREFPVHSAPVISHFLVLLQRAASQDHASSWCSTNGRQRGKGSQCISCPVNRVGTYVASRTMFGKGINTLRQADHIVPVPTANQLSVDNSKRGAWDVKVKTQGHDRQL